MSAVEVCPDCDIAGCTHIRNRTGAFAAPSQSSVVDGLSMIQEPKYTVTGSAIVNRASGEVIPADEPVFIFRARDVYAASAIRRYAMEVADVTHRNIVLGRWQQFVDFARQNPTRMKQPDTAPQPSAPQPSVGVEAELTRLRQQVEVLREGIENEGHAASGIEKHKNCDLCNVLVAADKISNDASPDNHEIRV